ncbi:MAG: 4-hydroxy-tetrahydrodipicolinate synthase [Deltaproteobacteria bacterium]|nr:4-hydroxy-tetrahydrodipicolinate synthase [Deltaproteobacteria bacterium]
MSPFRHIRLFTAIKTPYLENGKFDLKCFDDLVIKQIEGGTQGLIIGGTTGEGHLMSWDEHIMLIAHCVNRFSDKLRIIGNTGSNNTKEALKATEQGFNVGMHGSLQVNPYYGKTSNDGLMAHFEKVLDLGPAIIYNVPSRTNQDIPVAVIEELAKNKNLVGIKECAGNDRIGFYEKKGIACWSGNDDQAHDARHQFNAHGVISVTSNVFPKTMRHLMDKPDPVLNQSLQPFIQWLFCEPNPIGINTLLAMMGRVRPVFRLPYVPLRKNRQLEVKEILQNLKLDEIIGEIKIMEEKEFSII